MDISPEKDPANHTSISGVTTQDYSSGVLNGSFDNWTTSFTNRINTIADTAEHLVGTSRALAAKSHQMQVECQKPIHEHAPSGCAKPEVFASAGQEFEEECKFARRGDDTATLRTPLPQTWLTVSRQDATKEIKLSVKEQKKYVQSFKFMTNNLGSMKRSQMFSRLKTLACKPEEERHGEILAELCVLLYHLSELCRFLPTESLQELARHVLYADCLPGCAVVRAEEPPQFMFMVMAGAVLVKVTPTMAHR
ncbi:hypothetical protein CYMTET_39715, partial [Cymbomonas tetramitiformis]